MNIIKKLASGLVAAGLVSIALHAQEIDTVFNGGGPGFAATGATGYQSGDLVLGFYSAADAGTNGDLAFNIGLESSFTGLAPGVYSVAGFNGSGAAGQPPVGSGNGELISGNTVAPGVNTFWTVFGSAAGSALFATSPTTQNRELAGGQGTAGAAGEGAGRRRPHALRPLPADRALLHPRPQGRARPQEE